MGVYRRRPPHPRRRRWIGTVVAAAVVSERVQILVIG